MMKAMDAFYRFLDEPLFPWARVVLGLLTLLVVASFTAPMWHIRMVAPQYPEGLNLYIYSYKVDGGNDGADVQEISNLNHYIGMRPLDRTELTIIADPTIRTHVIEIVAEGAFGSFRFVEDVEPTIENPKTGKLAAMAVIKTIRQLASPVVIGG